MEKTNDTGGSRDLEEEFEDIGEPARTGSRIAGPTGQETRAEAKAPQEVWSVAVVLLVAVLVTLGVALARRDTSKKTAAGGPRRKRRSPVSSESKTTAAAAVIGSAQSRLPQPADGAGVQPAAGGSSRRRRTRRPCRRTAGSHPSRRSRREEIRHEPHRPVAIVVDDVGNTVSRCRNGSPLTHPSRSRLCLTRRYLSELAWAAPPVRLRR